MTNINQLSPTRELSTSDQFAVWYQRAGQPRKASISDLIALVMENLQLANGLLTAASLYSLKRTQAEVLALTASPVVVAPYDANGNSVLPLGGTALTLNVLTGVMQATRAIQAAEVWGVVVGSVPSPRVLTLGLQTGPGGGSGIYTSPLEVVRVGTGNNDCFSFSGILQNPNNVNGQIDAGDVVQLVASADQATNLSISAVQFIVRPLDGS
jgi:peptidoglycan hydrolase-like protein with peptidoglycan-binding domain